MTTIMQHIVDAQRPAVDHQDRPAGFAFSLLIES